MTERPDSTYYDASGEPRNVAVVKAEAAARLTEDANQRVAKVVSAQQQTRFLAHGVSTALAALEAIAAADDFAVAKTALQAVLSGDVATELASGRQALVHADALRATETRIKIQIDRCADVASVAALEKKMSVTWDDDHRAGPQ